MKKGKPKDFGPILEQFSMKADQLLVFGDRSDLDIEPALNQGCIAVLVPPYSDSQDDFDWMSMLDYLI
jgi:FMN phosphatase YigB (HAD superfamily)